MGLDKAVGGGLTTILPIHAPTHVGMARNGNVMVISMDYATTTTSWKITGMSGNGVSPIHVISDTPYTGGNGDVLTFSNVGGNTALNGPKTCTIANLSGTGLDCLRTTGNGTYTAGTGSFYLGTQTITLNAFDFELDIVNMPALAGSDPDVSRMTYVRHSTHRSCPFSDARIDNYYSQPHATIAQDGTRISWESNYCYQDRFGVYTALTGFSSPTAPRPSSRPKIHIADAHPRKAKF